jgi:hypothetical protein
MFWGAPLLARELERGTQRLAWTQSVTRPRWLVAKLGWLGLAVTVAGLALGLMVTAWLSSTGGDRFGDSTMFGATGVAAGAWWLFSFLLGASAGGIVRRLLPAMVVTIAVFLVVLFRDLPSQGRLRGTGALGAGRATTGRSARHRQRVARPVRRGGRRSAVVC